MKISSIPKSGRKNSVVYVNGRYAKVVRAYVRPRNPRTPEQQGHRNNVRAVSGRWRTLNDEQRAVLAKAAKDLGITPRPIAIEEYAAPSEVGIPGPLVGYVAKFERLGIQDAELAFWNQSGTLGDLLTSKGGSPNAASGSATPRKFPDSPSYDELATSFPTPAPPPSPYEQGAPHPVMAAIAGLALTYLLLVRRQDVVLTSPRSALGMSAMRLDSGHGEKTPSGRARSN